ncbi:MAG: protein translocase subunit SecF [Chloroflexota bacterium]|nr:protein translocase subunit SecF [Chloroflexota bacterium]MDE2940881.1 protein translocase subunit SecF [Chloroflexota bacterium]MDE3268418.1 protein translocase subunit SecF [Chloroflexota bacterium]
MDFVGKRNWFFAISFVVMVVSAVSLLLPNGLNAGLEFTGGSSMTMEFQGEVSQEDLRTQLADLGHPEAVIQRLGDGSYFIRTRTLEESQGDEPSEREVIASTLSTNLGAVAQITEFFSVSPSIATETVNNAILIVFIASIAILIYITWAFRRVPSPFRYGVSAIVALIHDVIVVLGVFSVAGRVFDLEVNAMFISGVLTIIGYSVHDTIVVFDRIRENLSRSVGRGLATTINISIQDTISRSLNTSLTLMFAILALLLFGGPTIQDFLIVLLIGITVGTYSSIWIASQVLMVWETGDLGRMTGRLPIPFRSRRRSAAA